MTTAFNLPPVTEMEILAGVIENAMFLAMNQNGEVEVRASVDDTAIEIVRIMAGEERTGLGTKAMTAACEIADSHGVLLELSPDGSYYEDEVAAKARLILFYESFGFSEIGNGTMTRFAVKDSQIDREKS